MINGGREMGVEGDGAPFYSVGIPVYGEGEAGMCGISWKKMMPAPAPLCK